MFRFTKISYTDATDERLMSLIRHGDAKAFETLYDRYFEKLVWFAGRFVEDTYKAEDAVQEVFVKIIEQPGQFDENRKFSTWVYTLTGNACKNILRNELNRSRIVEENFSPVGNSIVLPQNNIDKTYLRKQVYILLEDLNEKEKMIYSLRFEQELSIKEIAGIMSIPEGSVKSGIHYLLKKFAQHLKDFNNEKQS